MKKFAHPLSPLSFLALLGVWFTGWAPTAVVAQQAGGRDVPTERATEELDYQARFSWHPGGTPEQDLWQVLILLGVGARQPVSWNGNLSLQGGEVLDIEGYRFEPPDRVLPQGGWTLQTQRVRILEGSPLAGRGRPATRQAVLPKGLLVRGKGTSGTRVVVSTEQGKFSFAPMAMEFGVWKEQLDGRATVARIPPVTDLSGTELRQHDSPAIAAAEDGTLWTTWYSYHDRREELNLRRYQDGKWTRLIPVGRAAEDLWRPQIATDSGGRPWLIWSQQLADGGRGNWDIYAMAWEDNEWGELHRLTDNPLPDIEPHIARGSDGAIYVVWQALEGRYSQVKLKYLQGGRWSETLSVTNSAANNWEPSVAAGGGAVWIAWDRYNGNYDIHLRRFSLADGLGAERQVTTNERFEAHTSVAVDDMGRPWVAWETSGVNWGKDLGAALGDSAPGTPLGETRRIEVVCLDNNVWKSPAAFEPNGPLALGATGESRPLLHFDPDGNLWMSFKRRYSRMAYRPSIYWEYAISRLAVDQWSDPIVLPDSWARKSTRMGLASANGRMWMFWPYENRNWAFASRPLLNRVIAGSITLPGPGGKPRLSLYRPVPSSALEVHPNEREDVRAIRNYRIELGGETLRIARGDLHRHTELSQDVGGMDDGTLPEFYRYMIDAAEMDFGASTDHQAGGTDYWNFITQKMADMYHFPERFSTLYGYERNLGNPLGHRNMVYTHREYPIVPFFQRIDPRFMLPDSPDGELLTFNSMSFGSGIRNDTKLLYDVVKKTNGLAIPHTSGTNSMGTDWTDNDPEVDVVVEIYQGARQNYEHKNAPRGIMDGRGGEAQGGFQEPGMVWNAWKKGYRIGTIASSDHYSTHISYAMVYTPDTSRESIHDAIRQRRTYGATDNIILDFRVGDHFMGEDFTTRARQPIRVRVKGTGEVSAVHLIRDAAYIYQVEPGKQEVEFEYVDHDAGSGEHWYYVRVEQEDGELAWSSPIWVTYR